MGWQEIWTICRIFKRTASYRKYIPDWSDSSIKQNHPTDTSSKTCSFESDDTEKYLSFGTSTFQHIEKKPVVSHSEGNNQLFAGQSNCISQAPLAALYSSFTNEFFREENWDELGAIVECAVDPAVVYGTSRY